MNNLKENIYNKLENIDRVESEKLNSIYISNLDSIYFKERIENIYKIKKIRKNRELDIYIYKNIQLLEKNAKNIIEIDTEENKLKKAKISRFNMERQIAFDKKLNMLYK
ncbi:MAG: hypothetical protein KFW09_05035 [Oscillospiraceae bacterium]|nr:hypothetical protein [Oscillospiraceae bacterium]